MLEQEKREQEKQASVEPAPATALLSDADFERLRADVLGTSQGSVVASPPQGLPGKICTIWWCRKYVVIVNINIIKWAISVFKFYFGNAQKDFLEWGNSIVYWCEKVI